MARGIRVHFHSITELPEQLRHYMAFCWHREDGLHIYLNNELDVRHAEVTTAHELAHEILVYEGYPAALPSSPSDVQAQILATRLGSSILNALVNRRIGELGFDLSLLDETGIRALVRNTPKNPDLERMAQWENLVYNGLAYLDNHLDKQLNPRTMPELDAQAVFLKTIPGQWDLIEEMLAVVEAIGIEKPEQCLEVLIRLRDILRLGGKVLVLDVRSGEFH